MLVIVVFVQEEKRGLADFAEAAAQARYLLPCQRLPWRYDPKQVPATRPHRGQQPAIMERRQRMLAN